MYVKLYRISSESFSKGGLMIVYHEGIHVKKIGVSSESRNGQRNQDRSVCVGFDAACIWICGCAWRIMHGSGD
jgi:hypothetical protein